MREVYRLIADIERERERKARINRSEPPESVQFPFHGIRSELLILGQRKKIINNSKLVAIICL